MDSALLDKNYFFRDLTAIGKPPASFSSFISDQQVHSFDPERYSFYMNILKGLMDPDTKGIVDTVLSIENNNEIERQDIQDRSREISNSLASLFAMDSKKFETAKHRINNALKNNPTLGKSVEFRGGSGSDDEPKSYFAQQLAKYQELSQASNKDGQEDLLDNYNNDTLFSPDNERITATDRVIFIAMTFVWRGLALFVVQWALNSYMVRNFNQALMLYICTYLGLFLLWVILTNAADGIFLFKMLFYYISVSPHGYGRVGLHALLQLLMLPIPSIINNNKTSDIPFTFEESRRIYKAISSFTLFMWLFTTLVAVKY